MHFAMHAFSSHVEVLNKVTPIDLPVQSAVLFSPMGWSQRRAVEKVFHTTIYTFIHPIYGNQNHTAQAVTVAR